MDLREGIEKALDAYYGNLKPMPKKPSDISEIIPGLFISDFATAMNQELTKQKNIQAVINVSGIEYKYHTEYYLYHAIDDTLSADLTPGFNSIYDFIDLHLTERRNVLVHCYAGISRSVSYVIYYLMRKNDLSYDDAYEIVGKKRSKACPNHGFAQQLRGLNFAFDGFDDPDSPEYIPPAQKCMVCGKYLLAAQDISKDPRYKYCNSHTDCINALCGSQNTCKDPPNQTH